MSLGKVYLKVTTPSASIYVVFICLGSLLPVLYLSNMNILERGPCATYLSLIACGSFMSALPLAQEREHFQALRLGHSPCLYIGFERS